MRIFIDSHRSTYLFIDKEGPKFRHYITCRDGSVKIIRLNPREQRELTEVEDGDPKYFAEVYIKSCLAKSEPAEDILYGILGLKNPKRVTLGGQVLTGGAVSLELICQRENLPASKCRKFLRKAGKKEGGRWEWPTHKVPEIVAYLRSSLGITSPAS